MENLEQKHECGADDNGCIGHPITNMLMSGEPATAVGVAGACEGVGDMPCLGCDACPPDGADDMPPEFMTAVESMFEDMAGQVERAVDQIAATNTRTAHLVLEVEGLKTSMAEAHGKLDMLLRHAGLVA